MISMHNQQLPNILSMLLNFYTIAIILSFDTFFFYKPAVIWCSSKAAVSLSSSHRSLVAPIELEVDIRLIGLSTSFSDSRLLSLYFTTSPTPLEAGSEFFSETSFSFLDAGWLSSLPVFLPEVKLSIERLSFCAIFLGAEGSNFRFF